MSPLLRQSTIFLQSELTEELNSDPFWIDGAISSAFHEDTFRLLEGAATPLEGSPALSTANLLPSFENDNLGPPSASCGGSERVNFVEFTSDTCPIPFGIQPDDLFDSTYQVIYNELFHDNHGTCVPAQVMATSEIPPPASLPCDDSVTAITQVLSATHFSATPVDPSTMAAYTSYFDHSYDPSRLPSTPDNANVVSPLPTSPCHDSSDSDEGDADYIPPSDDDDQYRPNQSTSSQKKKYKVAKSHRRATFSPTRSTSSESERSVTSPRAQRRSHPYKRNIPSRNIQREDGVSVISKESDFHCPVVGCDYVQKNQRIPDLKRHVVTHDRWMEPEKWTCCGVTVDMAHLYDTSVGEGMTEGEQIKAGTYMFRGQLMIGGCLKTFARRDALKRHVDNPNISCVGRMDSYFY